MLFSVIQIIYLLPSIILHSYYWYCNSNTISWCFRFGSFRIKFVGEDGIALLSLSFTNKTILNFERAWRFKERKRIRKLKNDLVLAFPMKVLYTYFETFHAINLTWNLKSPEFKVKLDGNVSCMMPAKYHYKHFPYFLLISSFLYVDLIN